MQESILPLLKSSLISDGISAEIVHPSAEFSFIHLRVILPNDHQDRQLQALIWIEAINQPENNQNVLTLYLSFPFPYQNETFLDTARYLMVINKTIPFPGFGLSEPDHTLYYRYTLVTTSGQLDVGLIKSILGLAAYYYDSFAPNLEAIASGRHSFEETLKAA
jgi:hypothetical protein